MAYKPGKQENDVESYRTISQHAILSEQFKKAFLKSLKLIKLDQNLIPKHQFGLREQHVTVAQVHQTQTKSQLPPLPMILLKWRHTEILLC